jgi:transposase-like protein
MVADKPKKHRRKFSLDYKRRIVRLASACKHGEVAALLAREGLSRSDLSNWRHLGLGASKNAAPPNATPNAAPNATRGQAKGQAAAKTSAPEPDPPATGDGELEREIAGWERKIELARQIIEAQKRLREMEAELARG